MTAISRVTVSAVQSPFINSTGQGAYHPNADRLPAYAKAIFAAIPSAGLDDTSRRPNSVG